MVNLSVGKPSSSSACRYCWRLGATPGSGNPFPLRNLRLRNRPLERLEKDLKPPVIIKPNVPAPNGPESATPGRNPNPSSP